MLALTSSAADCRIFHLITKNTVCYFYYFNTVSCFCRAVLKCQTSSLHLCSERVWLFWIHVSAYELLCMTGITVHDSTQLHPRSVYFSSNCCHHHVTHIFLEFFFGGAFCSGAYGHCIPCTCIKCMVILSPVIHVILFSVCSPHVMCSYIFCKIHPIKFFFFKQVMVLWIQRERERERERERARERESTCTHTCVHAWCILVWICRHMFFLLRTRAITNS